MGGYIYVCNRQILLSLLVIAILVVGIVGISFGFFSYSRTGNINTVETGTIHFFSSQTQMNVANVFPITKSEARACSEFDSNDNVAISTVTITGDTSYVGGLDFRVVAQSVTKIGKTDGAIPISVLVTNYGNISGIVTNDFEDGTLVDGSVLASGHIDGNGESLSETITIKAFIDSVKVAVTDTYNGTDNPTDEYGTTSTWVNGRTVITTTEWNNLKNNPVSFEIRVESTQHGESFGM